MTDFSFSKLQADYPELPLEINFYSQMCGDLWDGWIVTCGSNVLGARIDRNQAITDARRALEKNP